MRNLESYHIPEPVLHACKSLGITTLAEFLREPERAFIEILDPIDMMMLYELVDEYGLKWGTEEARAYIRNYCEEKDQMFCNSMIYSMLEEDLPKWQEAEREYAEHPENFYDLTLYDEQGHPYIEYEGREYVMPDRSYDNFLAYVSFADEPLTYMSTEDVCMLLEARKFVKRKT